MAVALLVIVLVVGSLLFHFLSPWYFTPLASNWGAVDTTVNITFWVTGTVFVLVNLFMAYCIIRYRHRKGNKAHYEPESPKLEGWLVAITSIGVAAMLAPGLMVWANFVTVPSNATEVEVVGQQWHWSYRFPGADGVLGTSDVSRMSVANPFGVDPDDPNGRDDVLINDGELHLPIGHPVKLLLRSKDVLHDFAVPQFRVKMDLVPGMVTFAWVTPTKIGTYDLLCEELCGVAHYAMRGRVVVDDENDFDSWLAAHPTYGDTVSRPAGDPNAGAALYAVCAACHGAQGQGNPALHAPKLAGQESWYLERQLEHFKQGLRGADERDVFGQQMAPMAQTLANQTAIDNVLAYIATFPDQPSAPTVAGDAERGQRLFTTCAACHGNDADGIWSVGAPRLAGMSDWYLSTQFDNFKQRIRGATMKDLYGDQMARIADFVPDQQAVDDLIAYINTLSVGQ